MDKKLIAKASITIKADTDEVWDALTNPDKIKQYFFGTNAISDWKKGSTWQHEYTNDNNAVRVKGKVLESTPPKRLVISWSAPGNEADVSTVTFVIEPVQDMVRLDVIHGDFKPGSTMVGKVSRGWPLVLSSMKSFLENGKAIDDYTSKYIEAFWEDFDALGCERPEVAPRATRHIPEMVSLPDPLDARSWVLAGTTSS